MSRQNIAQWIGGGIILATTLGLMVLSIREVNLRYMLAQTVTLPTPVAPLPALIVTPGSEVAALQRVVETQQAQIDTLTRDLNNFKEDQAEEAIDLRWSLDSKLVVAGALASIAALLGFGAYASIGDRVREKVRATLDETILGYDPAYVPVFLPRGQKQLLDRLDFAGLKNIQPYEKNAIAARAGITVVLIKEKEDEERFAHFLENAKDDLDPKRMAFILYTGDYTISKLRDYVRIHDNLTPANTPTTLVSHVFNVGRGLRSERPKKTNP
jgi:hypothetical protein